MTDDRRAHDPFAPHTQDALTGAVTPEQGDDNGDGLDNLTKPELVELASERGVASYGTKADIIARLRGQ